MYAASEVPGVLLLEELDRGIREGQKELYSFVDVWAERNEIQTGSSVAKIYEDWLDRSRREDEKLRQARRLIAGWS